MDISDNYFSTIKIKHYALAMKTGIREAMKVKMLNSEIARGQFPLS
jgi:hypothetical protein